MVRVDYAQSRAFQAAYKIFYPLYERFYDWHLEGQENIPKEGRLLYVGYHSIHNHDLFPSAAGIYEATGDLPCALVHTVVMFFLGPFLRMVGGISGTQANAIAMYDAGRNCMCIPGGGEEAMLGFESAYTLLWKSSSGRDRRGFARLAQHVGATIVPYVTRNGEEMFFNVFGYTWNLLGLSRAYAALTAATPMPWRWVLIHLRMYVWFVVWTFWSLPVPVRAGLVFGEPIVPRDGESDAELAERAKASLQALLRRVNPGGVSYRRGLLQRYHAIKAYKY
ncbi:hypothetical protein SDRG_01270 [Saprolegnia diclina VS20]|uniref:Acyltransferase n=1 Tax=Saprolegnia diclina (strain VS20) TaxID=1156394 RepID=T0R4K1_SAPDV|nr:hypothetical protein SDRG_01270 [Saprolegnia diclina VS20]EQC41295.1 hypothetical protein SDRG_01270 [Saprolegnia diclina VS20]|eukprot:XP_008605009.1 hypothetical protein SDRG_01270 [Saprolegnia diclina VS20]